MEKVKFGIPNTHNLTKDEIEYELRVRGCFDAKMNQETRRKALDRCLNEETEKGQAMQTKMPFEKSDITQELQICRAKTVELKGMMDIAEPDKWRSRSIHIRNRLKRLAGAAPAETTKCVEAFNEIITVTNNFEMMQKAKVGQTSPSNDTDAACSSTPNKQTGQRSDGDLGKNGTTPVRNGTAPINTAQTTNTFLNQNQNTSVDAFFQNVSNHRSANTPHRNDNFVPPATNTTSFVPPFMPSNGATQPQYITQPVLEASMQNMMTQMMQQLATQMQAQTAMLTNYVTERTNTMRQPSLNDQRGVNVNQNSTPLNLSIASNAPAGAGNVTVVPYGQIPVSKWTIRFSGLPKRDDQRSVNDVNTFFEKVEEFMCAHRVTNADIAEMLNLLLLGPAHSYFSELKRQGVTNWAEIKRKFCKRFANQTEENLRHEIYSRKQKSDERTLDFIYDMCDLIGRLPTPVDEPTRIQMIFRGLDPEATKLARARNVLTVDDLSVYLIDTFGCDDTPASRSSNNRQKPFIRYDFRKANVMDALDNEENEVEWDANEFELLAAQRFLQKWQRNKSKEDRPNDTETKTNGRSLEKAQVKPPITCWNCDIQGHGLQLCPQPRNRLICYGCGKKDVTIHTCPQCSANKKNIASQTSACDLVSAASDSTEFEAVYDINFLIYAPPEDTRPHATVKMCDIETPGLLDTGAHVTVLGENHLNDCERKQIMGRLQPTKIGIRTADSTIHRALGIIEAEYKYSKKVHRVATIVMPKTSNKLLLGMDFMRAFNIRLVDWDTIRDETDILMYKLSKMSDIRSVENGQKKRETAATKPSFDDHSETARQCESHLSVLEVVWLEDENEMCNTVPHDSNATNNAKEPVNMGNFVYECLVANALSNLNQISSEKPEPSDESDECVPKKHECLFEPHSLTDEQQGQLDKLLEHFPWTPTEGRLNHTTKYIHHIDTGDEKPFSQKQFNMSPYKEKLVGEELKRLLTRGIISHIPYSQWLSRIVPARKKDGAMRICLDARELNKRTKKSTYPQMDINRILSRLQRTKYLTALDMGEAFFQIKLSDGSRLKTAFAVSPFGYFCFDRMPMGCVNSSAALCALIDSVFGVEFEGRCFWYVDDFLIASETFEEHMAILKRVADKLHEAGLSVSQRKSKFLMKKLRFLGMIISEAGIEVDESKVEAINNIKRPETLKKLQSFLGMTGFFRRFISKYSHMAAPLNEMIKGQTKMLVWTDEAHTAFVQLKETMKTAPILATPQYDHPFVLECDSSDWCAGSVLMQYIDGQPKVIAYYSVKYTPAQRKYSTTEKECLSVILSIEKFRPYIDMVRFTVVTDHSSLLWLANVRDPTGRLARWALRLQCFEIDFVHRPGREHKVPDALSRSLDLIDTNMFNGTSDSWYLQQMSNVLENPSRNYKMVDGVLYHKVKSPTSDREWKICVPVEARPTILEQEHDHPLAAHPGFFKTLRRIKLKYFWPSMAEDISTYVRDCEICRSCKASNENTNTPMTTNRYAKYPGQNLAIDYIGPYPRSKEGHRFAVVVVDSFTKFVFGQPLREATASATLSFLRNEIFFKYFMPEIMISDNGPQFKSIQFQNAMKEFNIKHWRTASYHPQANASECANKSIINGIRAYIEDKYSHSGWTKHFAEIVCAINTSPHTATKVTPYFAMHGREMVLDPREYSTILDANDPPSLDPDRLAMIRDEIQAHLNAAFERNKRHYNLRAVERQFKPGDHVWIANNKLSSAADKYSQKLAPKKIKAVVQAKIGENTYHLTTENGTDLGHHAAKNIYTT